jgi:hypothetical protein
MRKDPSASPENHIQFLLVAVLAWQEVLRIPEYRWFAEWNLPCDLSVNSLLKVWSSFGGTNLKTYRCDLLQDMAFMLGNFGARSPLWSSGQSSWLQVQRSGFDSRRYQIFWEVMGLERGPFNLVSTTEELFGRKSSGSGLERREYGRRDPSRWPRGTLYPQKLALTSPTSGGCSVDIVR